MRTFILTLIFLMLIVLLGLAVSISSKMGQKVEGPIPEEVVCREVSEQPVLWMCKHNGTVLYVSSHYIK